MTTLPAATEIAAPLVRRHRAGKAAIVLVTYPGREIPTNLVRDFAQALADAGLLSRQVGLRELAPEPVARLKELRTKEGSEVFSIDCDEEQLKYGTLISALNIHRNTFARERLCAVFWLPTSGVESFARHAPNFLDFRSRLVEVDAGGRVLRRQPEIEPEPGGKPTPVRWRGRYAAFISYAHRYREWAVGLHSNLEDGLVHAGAPGEIYLDECDLSAGISWIGELQRVLAEAEHLILVVAPEAMASPRVEDEWNAFIAVRGDRTPQLHLVMLVDTPLPPFLAPIQWVDFREHDDDRYFQGLRELLGGLLGRAGKRNLPELPPGIQAPHPPDPGLPPAVRRKLIDWLVPVLGNKLYRHAVAASLGLPRHVLDGQPSPECAASTALVFATGDDDPLMAARRVVEILVEEFGEDEPERVARLEPLRRELEAIEPRVQERGLLRTWLAAVVADHERLVPYFQQRAELDLLDRIYTQVELRPDLVGSPGLRPAEIRPDRALGLRELLDLDPRDHPWVTRRWVLVGDPGSGKTTLLRHLAAILAREPSPRWIPLFESLPRLIRKREWLLDRVARRLERAGHPARGLPAVLDQMGREGRLLLLLDGLDEVPRDYREEAESLLRHLAARWPETPFVVATRGIGYRRPGSEFREMEILPLDSARRREFLARWFGRHDGSANWQRADEGFAVLTGNRNLEELSGNPLYLTLMALLLEHGTSPARDRTRLYDQILHLLLDGKHRLEPLPIPARKSVHQALSYLAYSMTRDHHEAEPVEEIEARLYQPEANPLIEPLERVPRWRRSLRPFLDDVAERTGILGPHDGPDADWRFWHRTFREALAAERLEELWREGGETGLLDLAKSIEGDLRWWAEPYALLAGRVEDPDSLVKALVGTNRELGLRSLATAQGLRDETLAEILELSNDWRQRTRVYERLPELIGDPERALLLLDRLRPRTRDGNDLYFLDLSAAGVARLWPEAARQSAALRQRLYDHIPSPPEDLFRRLETPAGGRVRLWQEIPQGSFLMGSPEGEGDEDEHPLHTVKLVAPFLMASAPVTRAQYAAFDPDHRFPAREDIRSEELAHHPVVNVTWYAAVAFCRWLAASFSWARGARLASEAEWEYACRAGTTTCYWSGNDERTLARVGWFRANSGGRTHKVGEKAANPWGLYDLHGNVREWTASPWSVDYSGFRNGRTIDPTAKRAEDREEPPGVGRVLRGGGYDDKAVDTRAASRREQGPAFESPAVGFRVVISS